MGDTVRRVPGPWTPAVHALLAHLEGRLRGVPRVHGFDDLGREVLDFLPGRIVDVDTEMCTGAQLDSLARWTRDLHGALADFQHDGPWRFPVTAGTDLFGHNDIAPYNVVFDGDDLVGVFDWDLAGPTTVLDELAFLAWNGVPLWVDVGSATAASRLEVIATAYGDVSAHRILAAVPARIEASIAAIPRAAAAGDPGMVALMSVGEPGRTALALAQLRRRLPAIAAALG